MGRSLNNAEQPSMLPNSFQVPNLYVDRAMHLLTPEEWVVLTYAARRIFGFGKRRDRISISQFTDGITGEDGVPLDFGTGLSYNTVSKCLGALIGFGLLAETAPNDPRKRNGTEYALQLDANRVQWEALHHRAGEWKAKRAKTSQSVPIDPHAVGVSSRGGGILTPCRSIPSRGEGRYLHAVQVQNPGETQKKPSTEGTRATAPIEVPLPEPPNPLPGDLHQQAKRLVGEHRQVFDGLLGFIGASELEAVYDCLEFYLRQGAELSAEFFAAVEKDARTQRPSGSVSVRCLTVAIRKVADAKAAGIQPGSGTLWVIPPDEVREFERATTMAADALVAGNLERHEDLRRRMEARLRKLGLCDAFIRDYQRNNEMVFSYAVRRARERAAAERLTDGPTPTYAATPA